MIVLNPFLDSLCNFSFKNIGLTPGTGLGCFQSSRDIVQQHIEDYKVFKLVQFPSYLCLCHYFTKSISCLGSFLCRTNDIGRFWLSLKVSECQKQLLLFSILPRNKWKYSILVYQSTRIHNFSSFLEDMRTR